MCIRDRHTRGDLVFVDQPLGTGFSTLDKNKEQSDNSFDIDLNDVTNHFMQFLENYFQVFPEDLPKKLLLAGESYAGQYIPYFAKGIPVSYTHLDVYKRQLG